MAEDEQGAKTADTFTAAAAAMETFRRHMLVTTTVFAPNGPTSHGPQEELKTYNTWQNHPWIPEKTEKGLKWHNHPWIPEK